MYLNAKFTATEQKIDGQASDKVHLFSLRHLRNSDLKYKTYLLA